MKEFSPVTILSCNKNKCFITRNLFRLNVNFRRNLEMMVETSGFLIDRRRKHHQRVYLNCFPGVSICLNKRFATLNIHRHLLYSQFRY